MNGLSLTIVLAVPAKHPNRIVSYRAGGARNNIEKYRLARAGRLYRIELVVRTELSNRIGLAGVLASGWSWGQTSTRQNLNHGAILRIKATSIYCCFYV